MMATEKELEELKKLHLKRRAARDCICNGVIGFDDYYRPSLKEQILNGSFNASTYIKRCVGIKS